MVQEDNLIGAVLSDKYRILEEVGRGGMSVVYKAIQEFVERPVAIKMLQSQLVSDQLSVKRFQQEAQAASLLKHESIIKTYDFGIVNGRPYLVMDFLLGESLADVIKRDNQVDADRVMRIFIQACDALAHAHRHGVIHRDLKCSNIMLTDEADGRGEQVKVVDFGIAKLMPSSGRQSQNLTQTGEIFGSPIYMSPEQCLGHQLDARSDIYSMGTMMYEALTGYPALMGRTIVETMEMQVRESPRAFSDIRPDLQLPNELERVVLRSLEKKPENRYQSMEEMRDALIHVNKLLNNMKATGTGMPARPKTTKQNLPAAEAEGKGFTSMKVSPDALKTSSSGNRSMDASLATSRDRVPAATGSNKVADKKPFYERPITFIVLSVLLVAIIIAGVVMMKMQGQI